MQTAILHIGQLVTMAGSKKPRIGPEMDDVGLMRNAGILIRDGIIRATGGSNEIEARIKGECTLVDAEGRLVAPGFVDAHTHAIFAGNRVNPGTLFDELDRRAPWQRCHLLQPGELYLYAG